MTDEALFREALEDPLLERYSVIILDEAGNATMTGWCFGTCLFSQILGIVPTDEVIFFRGVGIPQTR